MAASMPQEKAGIPAGPRPPNQLRYGTQQHVSRRLKDAGMPRATPGHQSSAPKKNKTRAPRKPQIQLAASGGLWLLFLTSSRDVVHLLCTRHLFNTE